MVVLGRDRLRFKSVAQALTILILDHLLRPLLGLYARLQQTVRDADQGRRTPDERLAVLLSLTQLVLLQIDLVADLLLHVALGLLGCLVRGRRLDQVQGGRMIVTELQRRHGYSLLRFRDQRPLRVLLVRQANVEAAALVASINSTRAFHIDVHAANSVSAHF